MLPIDESAMVENAIPDEGATEASAEPSIIVSPDQEQSTMQDESDLMVAEVGEEG
jgi:hypothetical protein